MTTHLEEDTSSARLLNREVVALLFRYLVRYRRYLVYAFAFVAFITGSRLLVPYVSGLVIDRHLVKKGFFLSLTRLSALPGADAAPVSRLRRGERLDDSTLFLFRGLLSRFSTREVTRLQGLGVLSQQQWVLIQASVVPADLRTKIAEAERSGLIKRYSGGRYLFSEKALARFRTGELLVLRRDDWNSVVFVSIFIITLFLIQFAASYLQIIALMKLSQHAMRDLRLDLYRHLLSLELSYFDKNPVGRLVNRVTNDIETLNEMFSSVLVTLFQDVIIMSGIVAVMLWIDPRLTLVVAASFPLLAVILVAFRFQARNAYRRIRTAIAHLNAFLNENITGIRIIQIFVQEARQLARFSRINHEVYAANLRQLFVYAVFRPSIDFFRWAVVAGVIFFGAQMIVHSTLSYGIIVMFLAYIANLFEPIGDIAEKFDIMQSATAAGEKILTVFKADAVREIDASRVIVSSGREPGATQGNRLQGEIRFDNVWSAYGGNEWVLRGVSFSIPPRTTLAIVGETGSGKSTIVSLLARLYPYQRGGITIGGIDLTQIPYGELRGSMAMVMQEMFLFSRSLRENIILGSPFDEERWNTIVKATHVDRLIARLPAGAGEPVMERGVTFSSGERQLCAFARALYRDPSVLVLDEATSNIDSETESLIQDAIRAIVKNRTAIIIAHRLSTVRSADRIIVLNKGEIAEEGDHGSLLARRGLYHELYNLQFEPV